MPMNRAVTFIAPFIIFLMLIGLVNVPKAEAAAVQIRPLLYRETLVPAEVKKGFVDVSNASAAPMTLQMNVKGFRQIDDKGNLQFFASESLADGIQLDLEEVELGPREAVRIYFLVNSSKLPKGDVFAAIFASTKPSAVSGVSSNARVGTLLVLENGSPGTRKISIESLRVPTFNFGEGVQGDFTIRNATQPPQVSGFFPKVTVSLTPAIELKKHVQGPLVMSGISRNVPFDLETSRIGFYKLTVSSGESKVEKWLFLTTGYWKWAVAGAFVVFLALGIIGKKRRNRGSRPQQENPGTPSRQIAVTTEEDEK